MPKRVLRLAPTLFVLLALSAITLGLWTILNQPMIEPAGRTVSPSIIMTLPGNTGCRWNHQPHSLENC